MRYSDFLPNNINCLVRLMIISEIGRRSIWHASCFRWKRRQRQRMQFCSQRLRRQEFSDHEAAAVAAPRRPPKVRTGQARLFLCFATNRDSQRPCIENALRHLLAETVVVVALATSKRPVARKARFRCEISCLRALSLFQ